MPAEQALALARAATRVIVARGQKIVEFDMLNDPPDDETLLKYILGPSGNLRAPALRIGDDLIVGFNDQMYADSLSPN